jgi:hypothetical protein
MTNFTHLQQMIMGTLASADKHTHATDTEQNSMAICISQPVFHASLELNSNKTLAHMNFLA